METTRIESQIGANCVENCEYSQESFHSSVLFLIDTLFYYALSLETLLRLKRRHTFLSIQMKGNRFSNVRCTLANNSISNGS